MSNGNTVDESAKLPSWAGSLFNKIAESYIGESIRDPAGYGWKPEDFRTVYDMAAQEVGFKPEMVNKFNLLKMVSNLKARDLFGMDLPQNITHTAPIFSDAYTGKEYDPQKLRQSFSTLEDLIAL